MALTANREVNHYIDQELRTFPVKAAAHIYKGALVGLAGGFARGLIAGDPFVGVAYEEIDNTGGADGAAVVRVYTLGDFDLPLTGADRANNLSPVFATADDVLSLTPAGNSFVGHQIDVPQANRIVLRIQATPVPLAGGTMTGAIVSAGIRHQVVTKASAANVTIIAADLGGMILITGTTPSALNLPAAASAGAGAWCTFVKTGASGALTITPDGAETINGAASNGDMDAAYDTITIACTGTEWVIVAQQIAA